MRSVFKAAMAFVLLGLFSVPTVNTVREVATAATKTDYLYLVAGLDDAASNTDALIMVTYDTKSNSASVIHLPRDTFCDFGGAQNKINHIYPHYRASGLSSEQAMKSTADFIGEQLGVKFDGYLAVTTVVFKDIVDALGGVGITMASDFSFESGGKTFTLHKGENLLDGEASLAFVRHRKSYATGDLGRIDAQKIFLDGLYDTVTKRVGFDEVMRVIKATMHKTVTDVSLTEAFVMIVKHSSKFMDTDITYLTMPGEALKSNEGIWYYVLNRTASAEVIESHVKRAMEFDKYRKFTDRTRPEFEEIYNRAGFEYPEYTSDELKRKNVA